MLTIIKNTLSRMTGAANLHSVSRRDMRLLGTVKRDLLAQGWEDPRENYVPRRKTGTTGFSLNVQNQLDLLKRFQEPGFKILFRHLRDNKEINTGFDGREYGSEGLIHNGFYPTPDAELYAAMISITRPERIVEIGSGYSTVIARTAADMAGLNCEIHVIDPEPRRDVGKFADHVEYEPVERSSLADIGFSEKTLLFIDSSHVCRSGGDLPFLYCGILPALPPGVLVHIHDIFLPFDYPDNYLDRFYTEEYLLHALLANSVKFKVVLAAHYLSREHPEAMQAAFGPCVGKDPLFFGASFWIKS